MSDTTTVKRQAAETMDDAKDKIADGVETATAEAKSAGRRVKEQASDIEASLTRGAEDLAASVTQTLRSAGVDTDKMVDVAKEQASDLQRLIEEEVRERPLRALGIAAAIGLFVGYLSAR